MDLEKLRSIGIMRRSDPKPWLQDMEAYKRLRDQGLQPRHVDGSAKLEAKASDRFEIEMGHLVDEGLPRRDIEQAIERGRELELNDLI